MANDTTEEFFILFKLVEHRQNEYKVIAYNGWGQFIDSGYISATSPLRVYDRAYTPETKPLKFYEEPNSNSKFKAYYKYSIKELEVLDFSDQWLLVRLENNDTTLSGWLDPDQQCGNVWTTCN